MVWCRPAAAALIQPLAWELPDATGAALKRKEKERERDEETEAQRPSGISQRSWRKEGAELRLELELGEPGFGPPP